jgi:hypothetical protein
MRASCAGESARGSPDEEEASARRTGAAGPRTAAATRPLAAAGSRGPIKPAVRRCSGLTASEKDG